MSNSSSQNTTTTDCTATCNETEFICATQHDPEGSSQFSSSLHESSQLFPVSQQSSSNSDSTPPATSNNRSRGSNVSRVWSFTCNNPLPGIEQHYESLVQSGIARGLIFGREHGSINGTPHLQAFVRWTQPRSFRWVVRTLTGPEPHAPPHVEPTRDVRAYIEYCKKEGDYVVYGDVQSQRGKRTDLIEACESLLEHKDLNVFKEEYAHLYVKFHRGFEKLVLHPPRDIWSPPTVIWIYGPTGTGKTRWFWEKYGHEPVWPANDTLKWFDGYSGQDVVLFDDFRGHWCTFSFLLRVLDGYRLQVPVKGGFVWWTPKTIVVTSCYSPEDVYKDKTDESLKQLTRRITSVKYTANGIHSPFHSNQTTQNVEC